MDTNLRKRILKRHADLKKERASWDDHWRDISRHLLPRSGRFAARHKCAACLPLQKALLLDNILSGQYTGLNPVSPPIGKSPSLRQGSPDSIQGIFIFNIHLAISGQGRLNVSS